MLLISPHKLAVYRREAWFQIRATFRMRQFVILNLALPVFFYLVFVGFARLDPHAAQWLLATNLVVAAIGPSLFGFGASVAADREAGLIEPKRIFPMPFGAYVCARLGAAASVVALASIMMIGIALAIGVSMPLWRWAAAFALSICGVLPFGLIGLNLGLRLGSQPANALGNLLFIAFATLGLWFPQNIMPAALASAVWVLPSFHLGQLEIIGVGMSPPGKILMHMGVLAAMTLAAGIGAAAAWKRQDG